MPQWSLPMSAIPVPESAGSNLDQLTQINLDQLTQLNLDRDGISTGLGRQVLSKQMDQDQQSPAGAI